MRSLHSNLFHVITAVSASLLTLASAHAQSAPVITATIGTRTSTSSLGYFVLDFNDTGANPQTYAFAWNYEGTKTGADFILALESSLTGPNGFKQQGIQNNFLTLLGYAGRTESSSVTPNGFWNLWLGFDGQNWTNSQFGAVDVTLSSTPVFSINPFTKTSELSGSSWQGWRWVPDYTVSYPDPQTPRTPFAATATAAPEPGSFTLLAVGGITGAGIVLRRRRKAAGK